MRSQINIHFKSAQMLNECTVTDNSTITVSNNMISKMSSNLTD